LGNTSREDAGSFSAPASQESCDAIYSIPPAGYDAGWAIALDSFEEGAGTTLASESRTVLREFYDECFGTGDWSGW
jgi:hypothetical protein